MMKAVRDPVLKAICSTIHAIGEEAMKDLEESFEKKMADAMQKARDAHNAAMDQQYNYDRLRRQYSVQEWQQIENDPYFPYSRS